MSASTYHVDRDANQVVAANLRAELHRERWSGRRAAMALGVNVMWVNRRLNGETPMTPNDILVFANLIGIPVTKLYEGIENAPTPSRGGGGRRLPELDSNQQPAGYMPAAWLRAAVGIVPWAPSDREAVITPIRACG